MFAFFSSIFSKVLVGICLSAFSLVFISLLLTMRNLPGSLRNGRGLLRRFMRFSYELYASLIGWARVQVIQLTGVDLLRPFPRTLATTFLSFWIGRGTLFLLGISPRTWHVVLIILHGLFIGLAWEKIANPDDFQLGGKRE